MATYFSETEYIAPEVKRFQLSCESTADLPFEWIEQNCVSTIFYSYLIDEVSYFDDMGRDVAKRQDFYQHLRGGKQSRTSQVNTYRYTEYFRSLLEKGDVLHLAFTSGLTPSVHNAVEAAKSLREEYPHRKLIVIDTMAGSFGLGLLLIHAAKMRDEGASIEEVADWVKTKGTSVHHCFYVTDLTSLRRGGRISGASAAIATVLGICPVIRLDFSGHLTAHKKVRGKKSAMKALIDEMLAHATNGVAHSEACIIGHADAPEDAEAVRIMMEEAFPSLVGKILVYPLGPVLVSHCGIGPVAIFFMGDERAE